MYSSQLRTDNKSIKLFIVFFILEPRGLIRLLQFIFAIFAFATACNGSSSMAIDQNSVQVANVAWSYPYNLGNTQVNLLTNNTQTAFIILK